MGITEAGRPVNSTQKLESAFIDYSAWLKTGQVYCMVFFIHEYDNEWITYIIL